MNILIIEDERLTAEDMADTLHEVDANIKVLAILPSVTQATEFLSTSTNSIDLIFSDIQLQDGLSFDIFKKIAITTPIIFCTAYNEYALQAFDANGIDYILKPFSKTSVNKALQKFKNLKYSFSRGIDTYEKIISILTQPKSSINSILVYQKDKIIPISIHEVAIFYLHHELTHLYTFGKEKYQLTQTLEDLENKVGYTFFRANRQHLVNRKAIKSASQHFARKLLVQLHNPFEQEILVSKNKAPAFLEWLAN